MRSRRRGEVSIGSGVRANGHRGSRAPASRRATTPRQEMAGSLLTASMAILFAFVVIVGKDVMHGNLPFTLLFFRFGGAAMILAMVLVATARPLLPERGERLGMALAGIVGYGTESALYFSALNHGSAAAVTLLFYTYPVWVMLTTIAIDRRVPRGKLVVALLLAIGGSAVVVAGSSGVELRTLGIVLALCCSLAYSAYLISTDRIVKRTNPMTSAMWLSAGAAIGNLTYSFLFNSHVLPSGGDWWRVVGMAVFSAGAFACMLAGLQRIGAVRNAIIGVMEPLTVAVLAAIFLSEPITVATALGGTLILGGAVLATLVRTTRNPEPNL
jgi:drug/metabolite transporter (DMT)-like permease